MLGTKQLISILAWTLIYFGLPYWLFVNFGAKNELLYAGFIFYSMFVIIYYIGSELNNNENEYVLIEVTENEDDL
jgi:hypothetical protein